MAANKIPAPVGQRFDRLVIVGECESHITPAGKKIRMVTVACDCGAEKRIALFNILYGKSNSCGCNREGHPVHGMSHTPTWKSWAAMIQRCTDAGCANYQKYGARGISVCERWRDFPKFLADMGERPAGRSLDRHPNQQGNYEPGNCRWATLSEQARNMRTNRMLTLDGETLPLAAWAERYDINSSTIRTRLRDGWSEQRAITAKTIPTRFPNQRIRAAELNT